MAKASTARRKKTSKKPKSSGGKRKRRTTSKKSTQQAKASRKKTVKSKTKPARKTRAKKAPAKKRTTAKTKAGGTASRGKAAKTATKAKSKAAKTSRGTAGKPKAKTTTAKTAKRSRKTVPTAATRKAAPVPAAAKKTAPPAPVETPEVEAEKLPSIEEAMAALPYDEGSFVVHPKYGLGKVDRIRKRTLSTRIVPCLEISFPYQDMRLTIPVDQVERSGLRNPIGRREIVKIFSVLKGRATFDAKRRSAKRVVDYRKRLNMGDPTSLAEAVRDLGRLSLKKSLSYEERKILSTALRILSREVALARGRDAEDVREEIEKIVYR